MFTDRILRIGDRLIEMNGKLVTTGPEIGPVQGGHMRLRFATGTGPSRFDIEEHRSGTWTRIGTYQNIWDLYVYNGSTNWDYALPLTREETRMNIVEIIDACLLDNTQYMDACFGDCPNISSVGHLYNTGSVLSGPGMFACSGLNGSIVHITPFDTSSMSKFNGMFEGQSKLKEIPLLDTSSATDLSSMYSNCVNTESGILAAYNEMISHGNNPTHYRTFYNCGINTERGRAELAQIPSDWK